MCTSLITQTCCRLLHHLNLVIEDQEPNHFKDEKEPFVSTLPPLPCTSSHQNHLVFSSTPLRPRKESLSSHPRILSYPETVVLPRHSTPRPLVLFPGVVPPPPCQSSPESPSLTFCFKGRRVKTSPDYKEGFCPYITRLDFIPFLFDPFRVGIGTTRHT